MKSGSGCGGERGGAGGLKLISNAEERPRPSPNPELKAVLDDMRRRYSVMHARLEGDDTSDAA